MLEIGDVVFIPINCPATDRRFEPVRDNENKSKLLGTMQKIRKIEGERITVGDGWYFSAKDLNMDILLGEVIEKRKDPIFFNPENLMV